MAKYKLHGAHYLKDRYYDSGSVIEWDGVPSTQMEPLDDEALVKAHRVRTASRARSPFKLKPLPASEAPPTAEASTAVTSVAKKVDPASVEIPDNWRDLPSQARVTLARDLGAPKNLSAMLANGFIEKAQKERAASQGPAGSPVAAEPPVPVEPMTTAAEPQPSEPEEAKPAE